MILTSKSISERFEVTQESAFWEQIDKRNIDEMLLTPDRSGKEGDWVKTHRYYLENLRMRGEETLAGYQWVDDGLLMARGLIEPGKVSGYRYLDNYLRDMVVTSIFNPGRDYDRSKYPRSQAERAEAFVNTGRTRRLIVGLGGWGENDLAMLGIGSELSKVLGLYQNANDITVALLSHSGSQLSFLEGANLDDLGREDELMQIEGGIERLLEKYGLEPNSLAGVFGHSKGGWYAKQLQRKGRYKNAAYGYLTPAVVANNWAYDDLPKWLTSRVSRADYARQVAVPLQQGLLGGIIDTMIQLKEGNLRNVVLKLGQITPVMNSIAEYFVGSTAKYKKSAVAQILAEISTNPRAMKVQQRALAEMGPVMLDDDTKYGNREFVIPGGRDTTVGVTLQQAFEEAISISSTRQLANREAVERAALSPHNLDDKAVDIFTSMFSQAVAQNSLR